MQLHVVLFQWHVPMPQWHMPKAQLNEPKPQWHEPKPQLNEPKAQGLLPLRQMSQSFNEMMEQLPLMLTVLKQRQFQYPQMHFRHIKNRAHCLPLFIKFIYRQVSVSRNKMPNRIRESPLHLCYVHLKPSRF